jgi:hypothetical protein
LVADRQCRATRVVGELPSLVGVHTDGKAHVGPKLCEALGLGRLSGVAGFEDSHHTLEAGALGARDNRVEIVRERLVRKMAVTIDHGRSGGFASEHPRS